MSASFFKPPFRFLRAAATPAIPAAISPVIGSIAPPPPPPPLLLRLLLLVERQGELLTFTGGVDRELDLLGELGEVEIG